MPDFPITAQLEELATARRLSLLLATHTEDEPEIHVHAVLNFIAIDLVGRFATPSANKGGVSNGN